MITPKHNVASFPHLPQKLLRKCANVYFVPPQVQQGFDWVNNKSELFLEGHVGLRGCLDALGEEPEIALVVQVKRQVLEDVEAILVKWLGSSVGFVASDVDFSFEFV